MIEQVAEDDLEESELIVKPELGPDYNPSVFHIKLLQYHLRTLVG